MVINAEMEITFGKPNIAISMGIQDNIYLIVECPFKINVYIRVPTSLFNIFELFTMGHSAKLKCIFQLLTGKSMFSKSAYVVHFCYSLFAK